MKYHLMIPMIAIKNFNRHLLALPNFILNITIRVI